MEANSRPIPPPHDEDDEDVHWALSTATALWARGEREEALRWLRRAAEQASDANADLRALELFKAAAEVAQKVALDAGAAPAADGAPAAGSVPPKASVSAPPQAPGAPAAGASAPPPRSGPAAQPSWPPGPAAQPSRPPGPAAQPSRPPGPAAQPSRPSGPAAQPSRPPGPAAGAARPAQVAPERTPMPVMPAAGRAMPPMPPMQQPPTGRTPGPPPVARPAAAGTGGAAAGAASTAALDRAAPAKGRAITSFSSAQTRLSSTTAVTEEVPVVKLPVASVRTGRGDGVALKGAGEEQHATEVDPPPDQRETVPTNIAVGPGRLLGSPVVGAASSQEATERRPRLWTAGDEEGTMRRPLTPQEQRVLMEHRIEDLDEETPMLGLEQMAGDAEAPADARPEGQAEADGDDDRGGWAEAEPDDDDGTAADPQGESTLGTGELAGAAPAKGAEAKAVSWARAADDRGTAAVDAPWSDAPYEGEWKAPPPRLPAPQIEPLPALRVAVIGISSTGELRLVPMDGRNAPPRGAALGILVPLSPGDGETIARLLQLRG
ncbi:hypothetical protein WMF18_16880 [Sorangium sp. So ce315]|uniref:hypothetical protein n=1 Tax=Sorangium sp. So ce315 TaxID=3133299 RepID=UPI003F621C27